jgi:hypothetical protein
MLSDSCQDPKCASAPRRWPHSSGSLPTRWHETTSATVADSDGRWSLLSPIVGSRSPHTRRPCHYAKLSDADNADSKSRLASVADTNTPDMPPLWRTAPQAQPMSAENLPCPATLDVGATGVNWIPP